jgi:hypothetical protein
LAFAIWLAKLTLAGSFPFRTSSGVSPFLWFFCILFLCK